MHNRRAYYITRTVVRGTFGLLTWSAVIFLPHLTAATMLA